MRLDLTMEVSGAPSDVSDVLTAVAKACCDAEGIAGMEAAAILTTDEAIRAINRDYRGVDRATDVLSFPAVSYPAGKTARDCPRLLRREHDSETGCDHLGDFVISLPRAREQAASFGHSLTRELGYLTAHAMFHLMGYDHETDAQKRAMRAMEERAMAACDLKREDTMMMTDQELFERAVAALDNSYSPYSHFRVGACLLSTDGRAFSGCNIENASYGAAICAERCAVAKAVSEGARTFSAIAVVGDRVDAWPCGICRQVLSEFSLDMRVLCGNAESGRFTAVPLRELLPHAFSEDDLDADRQGGENA